MVIQKSLSPEAVHWMTECFTPAPHRLVSNWTGRSHRFPGVCTQQLPSRISTSRPCWLWHGLLTALEQCVKSRHGAVASRAGEGTHTREHLCHCHLPPLPPAPGRVYVGVCLLPSSCVGPALSVRRFALVACVCPKCPQGSFSPHTAGGAFCKTDSDVTIPISTKLVFFPLQFSG